MTLLGELRTRARLIVGPVLAATLFAYFAYHAVQGDRGLLAWIKLRQQVAEAGIELARIEARRDALAQRVRLMRPESLDRDLLEERVRAVLGYVGREDVVIGVGAGGRFVTGLVPSGATDPSLADGPWTDGPRTDGLVRLEPPLPVDPPATAAALRISLR